MTLLPPRNDSSCYLFSRCPMWYIQRLPSVLYIHLKGAMSSSVLFILHSDSLFFLFPIRSSGDLHLSAPSPIRLTFIALRNLSRDRVKPDRFSQIVYCLDTY